MCVYVYIHACVCVCLVTQSCLTLCDPMDCRLPGSSVLGDSSGKITGVGCHALLHGTFPTQGLNPSLLHCRFFTSWTTREAHICTYTHTMEYYSAIKKNEKNDICSKVDGPRDYHTKQSKSERDRQIPYDITYLCNLKYETNWHIYETKTDSQL